MDVSLTEVLAQIGPGSDPYNLGGVALLLNIALYIVFFLNLVAFGMQDEKQLIATLLCGLTLALIVIAKLGIIDATDILSLVINVGIFVVPFLVTGMSKAGKSKPITLIAGLIGGVYFFAFWFLAQRGT